MRAPRSRPLVFAKLAGEGGYKVRFPKLGNTRVRLVGQWVRRAVEAQIVTPPPLQALTPTVVGLPVPRRGPERLSTAVLRPIHRRLCIHVYPSVPTSASHGCIPLPIREQSWSTGGSTWATRSGVPSAGSELARASARGQSHAASRLSTRRTAQRLAAERRGSPCGSGYPSPDRVAKHSGTLVQCRTPRRLS